MRNPISELMDGSIYSPGIYVAAFAAIALLLVILIMVLCRRKPQKREKTGKRARNAAKTVVPVKTELPCPGGADVLVVECFGEAGSRVRTVCAVEQVPRFGGWVLGTAPTCNMRVRGRSVCARHVRISMSATAGQVVLEHLKSGRSESVGLKNGRWLPMGQKEELSLPAEFVLGDVRIALSLKNGKSESTWLN